MHGYLLLCFIVSLLYNESVVTFLKNYFQWYVSGNYENPYILNIAYGNDEEQHAMSNIHLPTENVTFI